MASNLLADISLPRKVSRNGISSQKSAAVPEWAPRRILISGMFSEYINAWLKVVGCRPRFRYLITLDEPISEFRNWWQMTPYTKDESSFRSWPSGHMTKATIMFTLPMLASVLKNKKAHTEYWLFGFAVIWIVIIGYNRIHMNAHFLTDVCFGVLITYCVYAFVYKCVFSVFSGKAREEKRRKKLKPNGEEKTPWTRTLN